MMVTNEMRKTKLKNVCDRITVGYVGPMADKYSTEGVPFLRSQNILPFRLHLDDIKFVPFDFHEKLRKSALYPGDVAVVRTGYPGTASVIPNKFPELNCSDLVVITPSKELNPYFLAAVFNSVWGRATVAGNLVGVAQQHFNIGAAREMEIMLPCRAVQDKIVDILSAYDDLMENNTRRIEILEQMVRRLYREWFVRFRFPGHEKFRRVASPLGDIPQGWDVTTLRAITTKIGSGATPRGGKDAYKTEGVRLIRSLNIYDYHFEFANLAWIDEKQAAELDNVTVQENDILLNITGASVARCALVLSSLLPARVNQHVAIVRTDPAKVSPLYVLDAINSNQRKQQLLSLAQGGATREALTKETVSNFEIVLPPRQLIKQYHDIASSIHRQREVLLRKIQNLRRTRDMLLPKLISGALSVGNMKLIA